jgi:hypothetical protein
MENGENKTTSFPLGTLKTWEVTGKKAVVIGLVDAHTLAFETKVRHDKNLWQATIKISGRPAVCTWL